MFSKLKELELQNSHRTPKKARISVLSTLHSLYIAIQRKGSTKNSQILMYFMSTYYYNTYCAYSLLFMVYLNLT